MADVCSVKVDMSDSLMRNVHSRKVHILIFQGVDSSLHQPIES